MKLILNNIKILKYAKLNNHYLYILLFLMLLTSIIELISIGGIYPLLIKYINSAPNKLEFSYLNSLILNYSINQIIIFLIFIYILRFVFLIFTHTYQSFISEKIIQNLNLNIFKYFDRLTPNELESHKLSAFIRLNTGSVSTIINSYFIPSIIIVHEFFTIILISVFIFSMIGIKFTLIILIFFLSFVLIFFTLNKLNHKIGNKKRIIETNKVEILKDFYFLKREINAYKVNFRFINKVNNFLIIIKELSVLFKFISVLPKNVLELLIIITFLFFFNFISSDNETTNLGIIPFIGTIFFATMRVYPSFNKIITSSQQINFSKSFFVELEKLFEQEKNQVKNFQEIDKNFNRSFQVIEFRNVGVKFDNILLGPWSFKINRGEWVLFKGASGAGKSTILDILSGNLAISSGSILLDKKKYNRIDNLLGNVSYVPQKVHLMKDTLINNISLFEEKHTTNKINKSIIFSRLNDLLERINDIPDAEKISGGQRQRLGIARLDLFKPDFLILDEATNALDKTTEEDILNNLKAKYYNSTLIMSSHSKDINNFFDKIIEI